MSKIELNVELVEVRACFVWTNIGVEPNHGSMPSLASLDTECFLSIDMTRKTMTAKALLTYFERRKYNLHSTTKIVFPLVFIIHVSFVHKIRILASLVIQFKIAKMPIMLEPRITKKKEKHYFLNPQIIKTIDTSNTWIWLIMWYFKKIFKTLRNVKIYLTDRVFRK